MHNERFKFKRVVGTAGIRIRTVSGINRIKRTKASTSRLRKIKE